MSEEIDIYGDLDTPDLGTEIHKLEEAKNTLLKTVESLENEVSALKCEISSLKEVRATLTRNISELYRTAKAEIKRKDHIISNLSSDLDDLILRRNNRVDGRKNVEQENLTGQKVRDSEPLHKSEEVKKENIHFELNSYNSKSRSNHRYFDKVRQHDELDKVQVHKSIEVKKEHSKCQRRSKIDLDIRPENCSPVDKRNSLGRDRNRDRSYSRSRDGSYDRPRGKALERHRFNRDRYSRNQEKPEKGLSSERKKNRMETPKKGIKAKIRAEFCKDFEYRPECSNCDNVIRKKVLEGNVTNNNFDVDKKKALPNGKVNSHAKDKSEVKEMSSLNSPVGRCKEKELLEKNLPVLNNLDMEKILHSKIRNKTTSILTDNNKLDIKMEAVQEQIRDYKTSELQINERNADIKESISIKSCVSNNKRSDEKESNVKAKDVQDNKIIKSQIEQGKVTSDSKIAKDLDIIIKSCVVPNNKRSDEKESNIKGKGVQDNEITKSQIEQEKVTSDSKITKDLDILIKSCVVPNNKCSDESNVKAKDVQDNEVTKFQIEQEKVTTDSNIAKNLQRNTDTLELTIGEVSTSDKSNSKKKDGGSKVGTVNKFQKDQEGPKLSSPKPIYNTNGKTKLLDTNTSIVEMMDIVEAHESNLAPNNFQDKTTESKIAHEKLDIINEKESNTNEEVKEKKMDELKSDEKKIEISSPKTIEATLEMNLCEEDKPTNNLSGVKNEIVVQEDISSKPQILIQENNRDISKEMDIVKSEIENNSNENNLNNSSNAVNPRKRCIEDEEQENTKRQKISDSLDEVIEANPCPRLSSNNCTAQESDLSIVSNGSHNDSVMIVWTSSDSSLSNISLSNLKKHRKARGRRLRRKVTMVLND